MAKKDTNALPPATPLTIKVLEDAYDEWQQRQEQLEELLQEANKNIDAFLQSDAQQPMIDPYTQLVDNAYRLIRLPNGENLFIDGKLTGEDIPKSSAMGERRQPLVNQENNLSQDWGLTFELCVKNIQAEGSSFLES